MVQTLPVLLAEFLLCMCNSGRLTYFFALNGLYQILQTLYTAYYAIGLFTYLIALISYLPYTLSFLRLAWRDSETRRLIFYRNCLRIWILAMAIDAWVILNLIPDVANMCGPTQLKDDEVKIKDYLNVDNLPNDLSLTVCIYQFQFQRISLYMVNHFHYGVCLFLAKRHWQSKVNERKKELVKVLKKVFKNKLVASDLMTVIDSELAMELIDLRT